MAVDKSVSTESLGAAKEETYSGKKFRIALIGVGGIAQTHIAALRSMPDVEIVAGVDIDPVRLKQMEETHKFEGIYTDWKKMLKEVQPDGVSVCTPNGLHMQPTVDALNAGAHVIVEKPMAMTPVEGQKMIDAAKKNKKKLTVGFQYRYHPNSQFLKKAADAGEFGDVMFVKCQALRRRGIPNWGVFGQKKLQGGGPMIDIGVHVIEMAHYIMGSPKPVAVTGNTWTFLGDKKSNIASQWPNWDYKTYTVEDLAIGHIRFENGAVLHIEASFCNHIEKDLWNFNLMGTKGGATWDPPSIYGDRNGYMLNSVPGFVGAGGDFPTMFKVKLRNFIDAATKGTPQEAPGEAGLAVQKILSGVYASAENGGKEFLIK